MNATETICKICHQPVRPEQGVHGATGNHWDCTKGLRQSVRQDAARWTRPDCNAIASGGYLVHRVKGETSLCGHTPTDTKVMSRARWVPVNKEVTCRKCLELLTQGR